MTRPSIRAPYSTTIVLALLGVLACRARPTSGPPLPTAVASSVRAAPPPVPPAAGRAALVGRVVDDSGRLLGSAVVVAVPAEATGFAAGALAGLAVTESDGAFRLEVPPGRFKICVSRPGSLAGATEPVAAAIGSLHDLGAVVLPPAKATFSGVVRDVGGAPLPSARVLAIPTSGPGRAFVALADSQGRYSLGLEPAQYFVLPDVEPAPAGVEPRIEQRLLEADESLDLAFEPRPPPTPKDDSALLAWLKESSTRIASVRPSSGATDLRAFGELVGGARVVAVGEATHGTREFFQLKHRLFEYLVTERGFTVFAIEAGWAEAEAVNEYVSGGKGTARAALAGLRVWPWNTEEVVELVEWMRRYNTAPGRSRKITFRGFDMQWSAAAAKIASDYLAKVAPDRAPALAPLLELDFQARWAELPVEAKARLTTELVALRDLLRSRKDELVAKTGEEPWANAEHALAVLVQGDHWLRTGRNVPVRDRAMADNVSFLLERAGSGAKMMVWAHNGHVSFRHNFMYPLGMHLRERYGKDYLAVGFLFRQGTFQARGTGAGGGAPAPVEVFSVGPTDDRFFESKLARLGSPRLLVDLRAAPAPVDDWFRSVVLTRQFEAVFRGEAAGETPVALGRSYDAILYLDRTTAAVPTPDARARHGAKRAPGPSPR